MRQLSRRTFLSAAAGTACSFGVLRHGRSASRPNVLFIAIDDLNHWIGSLGRHPQAKTPHLDALAARGVNFTNAYCAAPVCNASRAALMSGLRPHQTGVYENNNDWRTVVPVEQPLTAAFRRAGYSVRGTGKIYHESYARRPEWDEYLGPGDLPNDARNKAQGGIGGIRFAPLDCRDEDLRDYAFADWTIQRLGQPQRQPFFLACGFQIPHMTWAVPRKWFDLFPLSGIQLPPWKADDLDDVPPAGRRMAKPDGDHAKILESGRWKEAVQAYLACIAYTDLNIGRLIAALDASPHRDNTLVCLWSDHGWHLGEKSHWRKFALWEEATRSPHLWVVPGVTRPGGTCAQPVDFMGIYPTLCDLCDLPTPEHVTAPSLRPLLERPLRPWDRPALTTYLYRNHAIRTAQWRYIRYANGDEELYDELTDPLEYTNLAPRPEHAATKAALAQHLPTTDAADIGGKAGAGKE
ncbi:MAG: sulfatase [Fimbriimonadaceae bacterium]|nr:sulfatase [Fimbriimonadaceae bacterium]